jgi:hypothetical protein
MRPLRQEQFEDTAARARLQREAQRSGRHAGLALIGVVAFALATLALAGTGVDAYDQLAAQDDPVALSDQALLRRFDRTVAEREMQAALAAGDADLAQSFLDLARGRDIAVDPALAGRVTAATVQAASATHAAGSFVRGLFIGEPNDLVSLAGTALGDLFVFGDIRDATREGVRLASGQQADTLILGLACVGLAVTAGTYVTLGGGTPARIGLSLVKAARRTGKLSGRMAEWVGRSLRDAVDLTALRRAVGLSEPTLAANATREAVKIEKAGGLVELFGSVGRVEAKAGTQAALDSLKVAEGPRDMSRFARLAAANGGKTRAIIKLLGRAAIVLTASAFELTMWLLWAALMLLGFVSSCKTMVERMTLRHLHRSKARRLRDAEVHARAMAAPVSLPV